MSHFRVTACVRDDGGHLARAAQFVNHPGVLRQAAEHVLEPVMAPWDENTEMPGYRSYEEGEPEGYWLYGYLRRRAGSEAAGDLPSEAGELAELRADAELFRSVPQSPSWADIVAMNNEHYAKEDDSDRLLLSEDGRAYHVSTYNPESKWDYWRVGGRWGGSLDFRAGLEGKVVRPERSWDSPDLISPRCCDGGLVAALDLEATRQRKAEEAAATWREYQDLVAGTPQALPWKQFSELVGTASYTIEQARQDYHSQPRVQVLKGTDFQWADDPVSQYGGSLEQHAARARAGAVPGFATVTLDGKWMAPGKMGWWAMTDATDDTREAYLKVANSYIESLPEDAWLFSLDCHI